MTDADRTNARRLAFGRVAHIYDAARPSYPAAAIDALADYAGLSSGTRILEVGAGTGKATQLLAERGWAVLAVEPSAEMTAVARTRCADYPDVEIVESDFENWSGDERFPAIVSAQAWHWVSAEIRCVKARRLLAARGTLAAFWTFPDWDGCSLRSALSGAYRKTEPDMPADFPMHPDSGPTNVARDWWLETQASQFVDQYTEMLGWALRYTTDEYVELMGTLQDHILLPPDRRERLFAAITDAIDSAGASITVPFNTHLCLARRAD